MRYGSCWGVDLYESGDRKLIRNRRDQCRSPDGYDTSNECCLQISWQLQRNSLCFPENHCAHSSKAAGSPCRCARTSPAKWSEPAIRIGFWFARASISASPIVDAMEWGTGGIIIEKIFANSRVGVARSLRIRGRRTDAVIGASASQIPRKSLSERTATTSVAF